MKIGYSIYLVVLLFLFSLVSAFHFVKPFAFLLINQEYGYVIFFSFSFLCSLVTLLLAAFSDPGHMPRCVPPEVLPPVVVTIMINETKVFLKWCSSCNLYRPPRGYHCRKCDRCVLVMDHHCIWLNTCIGAGNYPFFICFLLALIIHSAYSIAFVSVYAVKFHATGEVFETIDWVFFATSVALAFIPFVIAVKLLWDHFNLVRRGVTTREKLRSTYANSENPFDAGLARNCLNAWACRLGGRLSVEAAPGDEESRGGNEESRRGNEESRGGNEESRRGNEESREGSEESRGGNEESRRGNEESRGGSVNRTGQLPNIESAGTSSGSVAAEGYRGERNAGGRGTDQVFSVSLGSILDHFEELNSVDSTSRGNLNITITSSILKGTKDKITTIRAEPIRNLTGNILLVRTITSELEEGY